MLPLDVYSAEEKVHTNYSVGKLEDIIIPIPILVY